MQQGAAEGCNERVCWGGNRGDMGKGWRERLFLVREQDR